ncbi:dTDP-4-dehydrorhamnose reductase [Streptosporangium sp. KLBMP 9127]|nr:dTDP-4-dehydrorhamnose reductase [Streptosporangium sp. KLBMP 9127]
MRWLITGAHGMLGTDLVALLRRRGSYVVAPARARLDVRDATAVTEAVHSHRPDVVVNCAAWTDVDGAESHEDEALAVNGRAVRVLAERCAERGARLIQISTDYVFDGSACMPYEEGGEVKPLNAYGRTKLEGERAALDHGHHVVRTAWLYGAGGPSFVRTMIRLAAERDTVSVVNDQYGQPTWTVDLAEQLLRLGESAAPPGVYHCTNGGQTTWYDFAREIFAALGADAERVRPISSLEFPSPARRPSYSVLGHDAWQRAGLALCRDWREAFRDAWPVLGDVQ